MAQTYLETTHKEIQVESWSNSARTLLLKGYTDGGPFEEQHTTSSTRALATSTHQLHGVPLGITVSPLAAGVRRGECYVRVSLMVDGKPIQRLEDAYLTDGKTLSWPPGVHEGFTEGPGLIRTITGTDPAANVELSETVPTNARWKLLAMVATLVTDATAANRIANLFYDDGTDKLLQSTSLLAHTASQTRVYAWGQGIDKDDSSRGGVVNCQIPVDTPLFGGYRIRTSTVGQQATDNWGAPIFTVEEWIEE